MSKKITCMVFTQTTYSYLYLSPVVKPELGGVELELERFDVVLALLERFLGEGVEPLLPLPLVALRGRTEQAIDEVFLQNQRNLDCNGRAANIVSLEFPGAGGHVQARLVEAPILVAFFLSAALFVVCRPRFGLSFCHLLKSNGFVPS